MGGPVGHFSATLPPVDLPDGLSARPLRLDDARAVFEVMAAQELEDIGEVAIEEADIVGDWARPSFDVADSTVGVFAGERLVAYGEHSGHDRGDAAVHPEFRARGIGTALARWMQDTARRHGATLVGMPVPQGSSGDRLLEALGYHVRWESWVLQLPEGAAVPSRELPEGYTVRAAGPEHYRAAWTVQEDAFLEWSERDRQPYEDWESSMTLRPGFEPWNLRVVLDPAGAVVAMAMVQMAETTAFIARLATAKEQRGKGLAQALLVDAFAVGRAHGAARSELSTDSRTGALGLYEKVGMEATSTWVNRAIALTIPPAP
jgi:GNAT superfamily N-acetyltransferase